MELTITRICSKCKIEKDSSCFYKDKRSKDGLQAICKECVSIYITKQKTKDGYWKKQYAELTDEQYSKKLAARREYNIRNKDKVKAYRKTRYPIEFKKQMENYHSNKNGRKIKSSLSPLSQTTKIPRKELYEWYISQHKIQNGCCAICGRNEKKFKSRLSIDHDHKTNKLRALLCVNCNTAIGYLQDDAELCLVAYNYLRKS